MGDYPLVGVGWWESLIYRQTPQQRGKNLKCFQPYLVHTPLNRNRDFGLFAKVAQIQLNYNSCSVPTVLSFFAVKAKTLEMFQESTLSLLVSQGTFPYLFTRVSSPVKTLLQRQ